ncbi:hypothetical protein [Streptomyces echinatus]|uniref:hypothetical protein n=1 Tax=Streptomyces echinatus TaxID=67293 RepID=UPI00379769B3
MGDTVRKPSTDASPFVAELLNLLEATGFQGAPRYAGQAEGFDIFTFVEGHVPARFQAWSDGQVLAASGLLRQMHDATGVSTLAGRFEVVCHHDPGPNNYVLQGDMPNALIDFAVAAPGAGWMMSRIWPGRGASRRRSAFRSVGKRRRSGSSLIHTASWRSSVMP